MAGMTHDGRLTLGKQLAQHILEAYTDKVLAVYIYGSTAKDLDRPHSDLEMIAVVKDGTEIPGKYYVYRGIVVDIHYSQESNILKNARMVRANWPIVADQYRHRLCLFERDAWFRKLDAAVAESDKADTTDALRAAAVDLTESISVPKLIPALGAVHARMAASDLRWGLKLEGSYISRKALRRYDPADAPCPQINEGHFSGKSVPPVQ